MQLEDVNDKLKQLLDKPEWSDEDRQWLLKYFETTEANELKVLMLRQFEESGRRSVQIHPDTSKEILVAIHKKIAIKTSSRYLPVFSMPAVKLVAASLIGLFIMGTYFRLKTGIKKEIAGKQTVIKQRIDGTYTGDIPPGRDKAVLTLADGSTIMLDDAKNGTLTKQGITQVLKQNGKIAYQASGVATAEILYNTISTPRGGQYQVVLPDGSRVWLNAASSLRFPTAFTGQERKVEITGEAYFEVTKNPDMPFIVKVKTAEVQVMGTHFNIMGYEEEAVIKTTLLEGAVRFLNGSSNSILKPGQQSQLTTDGQIKIASGIDVDKEVAWKNGFFHFESAGIETVMRQLSRWYDIAVEYHNKKTADLFYADIPRNTKLSDVLKALELTGKVHFSIEGNKVIVKL